METFAHYFCYATKQKKGQVPEDRAHDIPEDSDDRRVPPAYEIDEAAISDDEDI